MRPQPRGLGGRPGAGSPFGAQRPRPSEGPGARRRREGQARGWREPGFGGPGRGRAPTHLPAGAAARAGGQRGAAPGVHVVGDAQHPQEGEAEQHPRAPPHPPHSAAGRGAAARECCLGPADGAEEGEGRGAAPPPARAPAPAGGGGAHSAPSSALGRERRAAPEQEAAASAAARGVREQRATNGRAAAPGCGRRRGWPRLHGRSTPAAPPPLRPPAAPLHPSE